MREISPAVNMSVNEYLAHQPPSSCRLVSAIREQKASGVRPLPSTVLVDRSSLMTPQRRALLLDQVALLVDENLTGRADMCLQFTDLLQRALAHLGFQARPAVGIAIYYSSDSEIFRWDHAWVRVGDEAIDGNVDSLFENPMVPSTVRVSPYWGPITETPTDRRLQQNKSRTLPPDEDVSSIWWPELRRWLNQELPLTEGA